MCIIPAVSQSNLLFLKGTAKMTTRKTIKIVPSNASKADELSALIACSEVFARGTYGANLISTRLIEWFEGQMQQDTSCDIFDHIDWLGDQMGTALTAANNLRADNDRLVRQLKTAQEDHRIEMEKHSARFENVVAHRDRLISEQDEWGMALTEKYEQVSTLTDELETARREITNLKAKLYDLMMRTNFPETIYDK
jgi:regulator of replication initiation timing